MKYVLVTPARNEEEYLEFTIQSIVNQTIRPLRWVIVSDGSTDRTDEIAKKWAALHDWIVYLRMPERTERHFAGKVGAFNAGYELLKPLDYDVIGNLDADISFAPGYFEFLLGKLESNPGLGLTGTPFSEDGKTYDYRFSSLDHVSGACQLFRRECFEAIGGYVPAKGGGIDVIAVLSSRMKGWQTRTFPEMTCKHHRPMGSAAYGNSLNANYRMGQRQYKLGFHPVWQVVRALYQMSRKPYGVAGMAILAGYFQAMLSRTEKLMGPELVQFQRRDQMRRLRGFLGLGADARLAPK